MKMHFRNSKKNGSDTVYQMIFKMSFACYNRNKFNMHSIGGNKQIAVPSGALQVRYQNRTRTDEDFSGSLKITLDHTSNEWWL